MPRRLVITALLLMAGPASALDLAAGLKACRSEADQARRLDCYDALAGHVPVIEFNGVRNRILPSFEVTAPLRLVFESMDAIMVVYLLDASGAVVQNLHQAGSGSGSFMIEKPGRYGLQVNASGGWQIRLEQP